MDLPLAFESFFFALADFQTRHRALAESMATAIDLPASAQPTRDALRAAIGELVTRAQSAGAIRSDIGAADVSLLFSAVAGELQPVLRQRYLTIILDGLRPTAASELPGKPLDFVQLDRIKKRRAK